nr:unnamed protein product [Spirometra erinaceieuropaei]
MDVQQALFPTTWKISQPYISPQYIYSDDESEVAINNAKLYEKTRIKALTDERERVQKKTFTKWSNTFLKHQRERIEDLYTDLCDGRLLLKLVEAVSGYELPSPTPGRMRIHCLENVEKTLNFLDQLNVHLENVGAHDIVDGNPRIILGLLWTIILRFQVQSVSFVERISETRFGKPIEFRRNSQEALLLWCRMKTKDYENVSVENFTTSWLDGLAFNALIHKHRPDLFDYGSLSKFNPVENLEFAFTTAERELGIARLFDPEDILVDKPDEKSIITYLVTYYHYFARLKADTVHARRIERIFDLLKKFTDGVKSYEVKTDALLRWIKQATILLNDRQFENSLDGLQFQLSQFKTFRTVEKPPRFSEKGTLEIDLFVLRSQMLEAGMRTYVPPKQLQISEINKSWEILNVAEHSRGLALHDELIRLERLEQLFIKFEKKCSLREAWLKENEQLIHQELPEFSVYALQTSLKKHEALEADINAYEDRIQMIVHISNELQRSNYHRLPFVLSRLNFIIEMWHRLLEALRSHRLTLEARLNECYDAIEHDHLLLLTEDLQSKIERIPLGSSEMETEHSIKMLENIQLDFRPLGIRVRHLGRIGANLQVVYEELVKKGEEKKKLLRRTEQKWRIQRELKSETSWAQEKLNFLSGFLKGVTVTRCDAFLRKHKIVEGEIQAEEPNITFLLELSQEVIREDLQNAFNVEQAAISLKNRWNELIVLASDIKRQLSAVSQVLSVLPDIEDAEEWITEKRSQLLEASSSLPTIRDLYAAEKAVKKNQELLESVESFKSTINALKTRSYEFLNSNRRLLKELQTKSAGIGEENLSNAIQVHENVEKLISKRLEKLYACFEDLIELTKGNQAMLIDAFAIHQLFHSASSIYLWIAEKDHILGCIPMIDISVLDLRHIDADDCNETVSWINEKNAVIVALDQIDVSVSTGLLRLQSGLNAMQSDVVAIRAKVDDIGARIRTDFALESSSSISFRDRCKWLTAEHRHLEHMLSELETEVQSRIDRLSTNNKLLKHVDDLNSLLSWMAAERDRYCDLSVPANLADVERMLSEQEKNLESIYAVDENVRNILSDKQIFAGTHSLEDRDIALAIRAEQLSEEWEDLCKLAKLRLDNLKRQKLVQTFFAEAAALEVLISQQDSFLLKQDIPASVEVAEALIREHRAFTASLRACANRLAALTRSGTDLAAQDMPNHDRILNRLSALESRLNNNIERSELRGRTLEENFRLQKFFRDVEEIEDWISEKSLVLDSLSTFAKHDVASLFTRVQALQDEIEISRETADKVIKTGHQLVDEYAYLEAPVSERTEQLRLHWDDLVQKTQEATLSLSQSQTELFVNETSKTILDWADDLTKRLEAKDGDATTGMTDLQSRLAAHNNDLRTMDENLNLLEEIKDYVGMLSRRNPQRAEELRIVMDTLTKRLTDLKNLLSDRGQELEAQQAIALCLLELNTELLWARDKLTAIRPPYTEWPTPDARRPPGVQLLAAQRRGRRLDRYRIEVENRAPRVKQLCQKAERDYLSREAQKRIGSRAASFKNVLAELDEVWFILNHVLKVRIEEVQLVEAINKYVFDATDILAWISERELYLNSLERPTNVEENDRALRRLRILSGIVRHWTEEVSSTVSRGRKLNQDLRRGVQVDDEVVSVNEAARSVVTTFADRVKEAFDALCDAISGKTRELGEASELHDLLIDLVDLEEWIAKRHLTASSHDVGTDLEHCFMLRSRFSDFVVETKHEGGRRMKTAIARCDGLIARGHPNRSEVATCKDRLNEAWADLLEMMDTRQQLLKSALDMHRFYSDAQALERAIQVDLVAALLLSMCAGTQSGVTLKQQLGHALFTSPHNADAQSQLHLPRHDVVTENSGSF